MPSKNKSELSRKINIIAAYAGVDPRTAMKWQNDEPVASAIAEQLTRALTELEQKGALALLTPPRLMVIDKTNKDKLRVKRKLEVALEGQSTE